MEQKQQHINWIINFFAKMTLRFSSVTARRFISHHACLKVSLMQKLLISLI